METTTPTKTKVENYDIAKSDHTLALANDLTKFIRENKLCQNIQGKEYALVEAWQYAGARLGILAIVDQVTNVSTDNELKYQSKVNLYSLKTKQVIGGGFAICSNKEQGKKYYQEFAIASMSQTRAIGKAYRNTLAWIIKAAGYEAMPAEEMEGDDNAPEVPKVQEVQAPVEEKLMKVELDPVPTATVNSAIKYASAKQKEEILRLLNNKMVTRQEKTKMLLSINKLSVERADQSITKLKKVIENREEEQTAAA